MNDFYKHLWCLDCLNFRKCDRAMSDPTYVALIGLAEQFRSKTSIGLALECLTAASLLTTINNYEKAKVNMLIGKTLAQYGRNKGKYFMYRSACKSHIFLKIKIALFFSRNLPLGIAYTV